MKDLLKEYLVNRSDPERPHFSLACLECGKIWTSSPDIQKGAINNHDLALERAAEEAMQEFQFCPICGHVVCNHCLITCGDLSMCRACARELNQYEGIMKGRDNRQRKEENT